MERYGDVYRGQSARGRPPLERVYRHFRRNLIDICGAATNSGADVLLSTVATNLKDSAPFASLHRKELSDTDLRRWEQSYQLGVSAEATKDAKLALEHFQKAEALDDRFADLHFRMARCYLSLGQSEEAKRHYVLARDVDALRFRADSRLNQVIRDVVGELNSDGISLVDAEKALGQDSTVGHGILGEELFHEHVHFNFDGNYLLAKTVAQALEHILSSRLRGGEVRPAFLTRDQVSEEVAFTGWDRWRIRSRMSEMMSRPPFTNQMDDEQRSKRRRAEVYKLRRTHAGPAALDRTPTLYEQAIEKHPDDLYFRLRYAELLAANRDFTTAAGEWRKLLKQVPGHVAWQMSLAAALRDAGRLEEAIAQYRCVLRTHPDFPAARFGIGSVMQKQGKWEEAIRQEFQPLAVRGSTEAQYYLGWMYDGGRGTPQDDIQTVKWYRMAAAQGHARAQANLGRMYTEGRGVAPDDVEAVKWYRKAATQGLAAVQSYLGLMYAEGRGVPRDGAKVLEWFGQAAEQGLAAAQAYVGLMYAKGRGVPQDWARAHLWLSLAARQGDKDAADARGLIAKKMTCEQIMEAQRLASEWNAD